MVSALRILRSLLLGHRRGCDASQTRRPLRSRGHARMCETLASEKFEGRMAGSRRRTTGGRVHRARADARSAPSRCQARRICFTRSSSPRAPRTRDRALTVTQDGRRRRARSTRPTQVQALSFSDSGGSQRPGRVRRLRPRRAGEPELRLRQLRRARRQGQGRPRASLLSRGRRSEDAGDPRALLGPSLQGDGGAPARRQGAARGRPDRARRTPARRFR